MTGEPILVGGGASIAIDPQGVIGDLRGLGERLGF
jgi:hypothetical protein